MAAKTNFQGWVHRHIEGKNEAAPEGTEGSFIERKPGLRATFMAQYAAAFLSSDLYGAQPPPPEDVVVQFNGWLHVPIKTFVFSSWGPEPQGDLGDLSARFPVEVLEVLFRELDVATAFSLSHTCRYAQSIMARLPEFRVVSDHGLNAVCAMLRTGIAPEVGIATLACALMDRQCSLCDGRDAFFVNLFTGTRVCNQCLYCERFQVGRLSALHQASGIAEDQLRATMPVIRTLRQGYGLGQPCESLELVPKKQCLGALARAGIADPEAVWDSWPKPPEHQAHMLFTRLPHLNPATGVADPGVVCASCLYSKSRDTRLQLAVYAISSKYSHNQQCPSLVAYPRRRQETNDGDFHVD